MPNQGGMGNPHEERYFYENFRDWGQDEPWAKDVVYDPRDCAKSVQDPNRKEALKDFFCTFREELKKFVFISKRPAFVEPPFFSKPLIKTNRVTAPAGITTRLAVRQIDDRQRAVVSSMGVDTDNPTAYVTGALRFSFSQSDLAQSQGVNVPLFDDQNPVTTFQIGLSEVIPGDTVHPYDLIQSGTAFQVKGPAVLRFSVTNLSGVPVIVRSVVGMYQYWLPKADEFASADLQL
jgi:hypothetical protein